MELCRDVEIWCGSSTVDSAGLAWDHVRLDGCGNFLIRVEAQCVEGLILLVILQGAYQAEQETRVAKMEADSQSVSLDLTLRVRAEHGGGLYLRPEWIGRAEGRDVAWKGFDGLS